MQHFKITLMMISQGKHNSTSPSLHSSMSVSQTLPVHPCRQIQTGLPSTGDVSHIEPSALHGLLTHASSRWQRSPREAQAENRRYIQKKTCITEKRKKLHRRCVKRTWNVYIYGKGFVCICTWNFKPDCKEYWHKVLTQMGDNNEELHVKQEENMRQQWEGCECVHVCVHACMRACTHLSECVQVFIDFKPITEMFMKVHTLSGPSQLKQWGNSLNRL